MTFRTSDILIGGSLIIIGLAEVAHLAGCLLGWSFLSVTDLMLAETIVMVPAMITVSLLRHKKAMSVSVVAGKTAPGKNKTIRTQQILTGVLIFWILLQILRILTEDRAWLDGDMTLETVRTFLAENAIYTVNPLTGIPYVGGVPFRLKILCLPTLYGTISRWTGMAATDVVYRLIPCITLILGYLAYGKLGRILFGENPVKRKTFLLIVGILFSAGAYMPGVDGFDIFYGGFRGVTIRGVVLIPYLIACLMEKNYWGVILCILAEACMVWTLYGAGICLFVTAAWLFLRWLSGMICRRKAQSATASGEGDTE